MSNNRDPQEEIEDLRERIEKLEGKESAPKNVADEVYDEISDWGRAIGDILGIK